MADVVDYKIYGSEMQSVEIELDPGEGIRAETGAMLYMEDRIEMQTSTGGGLLKGFKRLITGESFFITSFTYHGTGKGHVAFGAPYPAKSFHWILPGKTESSFARKTPFYVPLPGLRSRWLLPNGSEPDCSAVRDLFCSA